MASSAIRIIREEHAALAAMLRTLGMLLAQHRRENTLADFGTLRAMLFYIDEFPERLHHTKESNLLFPRLRQRSPDAREVLDKLDRDHAQGESAIRNLQHALLGFEMMGEARRAEFERAAERYIAFYLDHMRTEETEVLPLAERVLRPEDWAAIDSEFERNRDPLTGHQPGDEYRELFSRIVRQVPAPLGLG